MEEEATKTIEANSQVGGDSRDGTLMRRSRKNLVRVLYSRM